ncbi:MAG TPA: DUF1326 domain-containing protein [Candidatus Limnocylindrales bacterium]|nr:DUF1326 domain-containing protein [Candidatus Limnocylindrales bacterium]
MTQATPNPTTRTPYWLKGHWIETCNCDPGCNCNFGGFPDHGSCHTIVGIEVIEGHYGEVDLAGVRTVFAVKYPGALHEGHGRSVLFIDESASPEQVKSIKRILSGRAGGMPWEVLAPTIEVAEGPILKPIEMKVEGRRSYFRIPGILEVRLTPLKNPVTGEEHEVHIVLPRGGLIWNDGDAATTEIMSINYSNIQFEYPGQNGIYALVEWTNQK